MEEFHGCSADTLRLFRHAWSDLRLRIGEPLGEPWPSTEDIAAAETRDDDHYFLSCGA